MISEAERDRRVQAVLRNWRSPVVLPAGVLARMLEDADIEVPVVSLATHDAVVRILDERRIQAEDVARGFAQMMQGPVVEHLRVATTLYENGRGGEIPALLERVEQSILDTRLPFEIEQG